MSELIDVSDIPAALLLAQLYNNSKPQGMGFLHYDPQAMSQEWAQAEIDEVNSFYKKHNPDSQRKPYFDYLHGRVMKVEINGKTLDPWLYDRDNGTGEAMRCVEACRVDEICDLEDLHESHS